MSEDPQQFPKKFADEEPYTDEPGIQPDDDESNPEDEGEPDEE